MTDTTTATPTTSAQAQAMADQLRAYGAPKVSAVATFMTTDAMVATITTLEGYAADFLPDGNTKTNINNALICLRALRDTSKVEAASLAPPTPPAS